MRKDVEHELTSWTDAAMVSEAEVRAAAVEVRMRAEAVSKCEAACKTSKRELMEGKS